MTIQEQLDDFESNRHLYQKVLNFVEVEKGDIVMIYDKDNIINNYVCVGHVKDELTNELVVVELDSHDNPLLVLDIDELNSSLTKNIYRKAFASNTVFANLFDRSKKTITDNVKKVTDFILNNDVIEEEPKKENIDMEYQVDKSKLAYYAKTPPVNLPEDNIEMSSESTFEQIPSVIAKSKKTERNDNQKKFVLIKKETHLNLITLLEGLSHTDLSVLGMSNDIGHVLDELKCRS